MKRYQVAMLGVCGGVVLAGTVFFISSLGNLNGQVVQTQVSIDDEAVPLYAKPATNFVRKPEASGKVVFKSNDGNVILDASNTTEGYVMVKYSGGNSKIKVQVSKSGGEVYTYNLSARSAYEVFPLSEGNGVYTVKVFENISGNQYAQVFSQNVQGNMKNQFAPFLYPNQYVNFNSSSAVVKKSEEISAGITDQLQVVNAIYNYVVKTLTYDTVKAETVESGYLPNVDQVLETKQGICFDYAAVMAAMLRAQDIPAKLVIGYTGDVYHAWINVYIEELGWVDNVIYFDGQKWELLDPTFASSGNNSPEIVEYISNSSNYAGKYAY